MELFGKIFLATIGIILILSLIVFVFRRFKNTIAVIIKGIICVVVILAVITFVISVFYRPGKGLTAIGWITFAVICLIVAIKIFKWIAS